MTKELVYVGPNIYVIGDRIDCMPVIRSITDKRLIELYKKEGRTAYVTNTPKQGHLFADGPFSTFAEAKKFIESSGDTLKLS